MNAFPLPSAGARPPMGRVSVITVCLNAGPALAPTLASVREQTFPGIEHVVIDGGSTDGSLERLRRHAPEVLVSEPDDGIYAAMQKGARAASGDALFFLNAGDVFHDRDVVSDVAAFFDRTGADAVFGNLLPVYADTGDRHDHAAFHDGQVMDLSYFNNRRLWYDESVHHQTMFYRREIFEHCGFLCDDPRATGEYHLNCCAFVARGHSLKHLPRVVCRFALGGHSTRDFAREWQRFSTARDILRARFFPDGPRVPLPGGPDEYLVAPPSLRNRLKIATRGTPLAPVLAWGAHRARRVIGAVRRLRGAA